MAAGNFQKLTVWQKSKVLSVEVVGITRKLPKDEQFELSSQMRQAANSISYNISGGYGRGTRKEYVNFLHIAHGSNCELQTELVLCVELGYVSKDDTKQALSLSYEVGRMLRKIIAVLKENQESVTPWINPGA